jgi:3-phosphoshikimate 1-carboxyvinyltransferase
LAEFGAHLKTEPNEVEIEGGHELRGKEFSVPGDVSSAAFFIAASLAVPGSRLRLTGVGLNPTRTGFIRLLQQARARISTSETSVLGGEALGDIIVESSEIDGMDVGGAWIPNIIDEIPMLAVLGTVSKNGFRIREATELRAKESDRISAVAQNLRALGARVEEYPDGLFVPGNQRLTAGTINSFNDHRIAMAFAVAGLFADGPVTIQRPECAAISFPGFFEALYRLKG